MDYSERRVMKLSKPDLGILLHTLGLNSPRGGKRNSFVCGEGSSDFDGVKRLCAAGMMVQLPSLTWMAPGDLCFMATDAGREYAIANAKPRSKENILKDIVRFEAREAERAREAAHYRKEMCDAYSNFVVGDLLSIRTGQTTMYGVVQRVDFRPGELSDADGFTYYVSRRKKNGDPVVRLQKVYLWRGSVVKKIRGGCV